MDLRSIVPYLSWKSLSVKDVHLDVVHTLGRDVVASSTITLYVCDAHSAVLVDPEAASDHDHKLDDSGQAILAALSEQRFTSIHESSCLTHLSESVVHRSLA
jgi:hypothetical protein